MNLKDAEKLLVLYLRSKSQRTCASPNSITECWLVQNMVVAGTNEHDCIRVKASGRQRDCWSRIFCRGLDDQLRQLAVFGLQRDQLDMRFARNDSR